MGKRIRLREAQYRAAQSKYAASLEEHSRTDTRPSPIERYGQFDSAWRAKIDQHRQSALRRPEDWRCPIKSRSADKRYMDLVRFTFARYRVPAHLENIWIADYVDDFADTVRPLSERAGAMRPVDLRAWYVIAAQGRSLYKLAAHPHLTKIETHHFQTPPSQVASAGRAFWYAYARAQADAPLIALNVSQTKLTDFSVGSSFWKEVARFFALNPMPVPAMNDMIDFLLAAKTENLEFVLKGRTLGALCRRMEDWHHELRRQHTVCGGFWPGSPMPDTEYRTGKDDKRAIWRFKQIKTGNDLFREGQRMHHCVASYKGRCVSGEVSIWSLTSEFPIGHLNRGVTIELRKGGVIAQCRGFANRMPLPNELTMIRRWANEHGLSSFAL